MKANGSLSVAQESEEKVSEIFYRRLSNDEYVPVSPLDTVEIRNCQPGTYIVHVEKNSFSSKLIPQQENAAFLAITRPLAEELKNLLMRTASGTPEPISPEAQMLWDEMASVGVTHIRYPSVQELVDQAFELLAEKHADVANDETVRPLLKKIEMIVALRGK